MKAAPFRYVAPDTLDEVLDVLGNEDEGRVIAGGQSLVPMMVMRATRPEVLIDLRNVESLHAIRTLERTVEVGAMVSQSIAGARRSLHPLVREAIPLIAHAQIRNRGTVCGSLAHADPSAELPAVAVALGARLRARGPDGERWIDASDFFESYFTTSLEHVEVVTLVEIPRPAAGEGWAIAEVARRKGDYALAGVAVRLVTDERQLIRDASVVPFAVGERPISSQAARDALVGERLSAGLVSDVAQVASNEVNPSSDVHASSRYRRHAVRVLTRRTLERAGTLAS